MGDLETFAYSKKQKLMPILSLLSVFNWQGFSDVDDVVAAGEMDSGHRNAWGSGVLHLYSVIL